MKRLAAEPGDIVRWAPDGVYVNDELLPNSKVPAKSPYPHYPYQTLWLQKGQYLMMGNNALSWDGRYTGPEPQILIQSKVYPLWRF